MEKLDAQETERLTLKAMELLRMGKTQDAADYLQKAAQSDHPIAANQLGAMLEHGHGVTQDLAAAMENYAIAAAHGMALAQFNIGFLYHMGKGVDVDYVAARAWYEKAAAANERTCWLFALGESGRSRRSHGSV